MTQLDKFKALSADTTRKFEFALFVFNNAEKFIGLWTASQLFIKQIDEAGLAFGQSYEKLEAALRRLEEE